MGLDALMPSRVAGDGLPGRGTMTWWTRSWPVLTGHQPLTPGQQDYVEHYKARPAP
jgi:hypothetical protein